MFTTQPWADVSLAFTAVQVRKTNRPSDWQARFYEEDVALKQIGTSLDAAQ